MDAAVPRYRVVIGAVSLIVAPALMSVGDLFHPHESWDPVVQLAMVAEAAARWYAAHLLLFIGMLLFVPGIVELTRVAASRRPVAGYAARVLMLVAVGALSAVFVFEMVLGRFVLAGADRTAAVALLEIFQAPAVFAALLPGLLAFFIGTGLAVRALASAGDPFRWPALGFALGAIFIMGEIISAQVLLSQIGNILMFVSGAAFARVLLRDRGAAPV